MEAVALLLCSVALTSYGAYKVTQKFVYLVRRIRLFRTMSAVDQMIAKAPREAHGDGHSVMDVGKVKAILVQKGLPLELIYDIIDFAEYWPHTTMESHHSHLAFQSRQNVLVLRSLPIGYEYHDEKSRFSIPLDAYSDPALLPAPNSVDFGEAVNDATGKVLRNWASQSQIQPKCPCRKIVFTIRSKDQGWGGDHRHRGTYEGSFSWFDVGRERTEFLEVSKSTVVPAAFTSHLSLGLKESKQPSFKCLLRPIMPIKVDETDDSIMTYDHPFMPEVTFLQSNVTAGREPVTHVITWSCTDDIDPESAEGEALASIGRGRASGTGDYVRSLKLGDIVTVWARARFPGWTNQVESVKIDVYWAV